MVHRSNKRCYSGIMGRRTAALLPVVQRLLETVGSHLRLARLRRRLQARQVAERAGMSVMTLRALERGSPGVTIGAYAAVLHVLGLHADLELLGKSDPLGRKLQDAQLTVTMSPRRMPPSRARSAGRS